MADEPAAAAPAQDSNALIMAMLSKLFASNPEFLTQMQNQLQASQLAGSDSPLTEAANLGWQREGAQKSIRGLLTNPADEGAYADFWDNPGTRLPQLQQQEGTLKNSLQAARENYIKQHGGVKQMMLQNGPAFNTDTGAGVDDYNKALKNEDYLPAYLKPSSSVPSYMQQRALDFRMSHPQASDMGTGPDAISYEGLKAVGDQAAAKYGDQYAPGGKWATP